MRECCYSCPYKSLERQGDISIADAWGIAKAAPQFDDNHGVSLVLCSTKKGQEWLEKAFVELSDVSKKILYLHMIEGKTLTEIADVIGYSYRHTKRLYSLSIEELRIYKEKHYGN